MIILASCVVTGDNLSKAMIDAAGSEELNQQIEKLGFANVPNLDLPPCAAQCKASVSKTIFYFHPKIFYISIFKCYFLH